MTDNPPPKQYKSVRLSHYDYSSAGGYSVTIVAAKRACMFGEIVDGKMLLNVSGRIIHDEWLRSSEIRPEIILDEFIVMPNHFHGIVIIQEGVHCRATLTDNNHSLRKLERRPRSLSSLLSGFKAFSTKRINELRGMPGKRIWQPSFHEHIIRNEIELNRIREYIINNPLKWHLDEENPDRINPESTTTR